MSGTLFDDPVEPLPEPRCRAGFLVMGPNASGNTTAAKAAAGADPRVRLVDADSEMSGADIATIEQRLRDLWVGRHTVVVVVGTNRAATALGRIVRAAPDVRTVEAYVTSLSPDTMQALMQARCAKRGKTYRADYWNRDRLTYEGQRRYARLSSEWYAGRYTTWAVEAGYAAATELAQHLRERIETCLAD